MTMRFPISPGRGALTALSIILLFMGIAYMASNGGREVNYITITGKVSDLQRESVTRTLLAMDTNLSDIKNVKKVLSHVGWINDVDVALRWPDELIVDVSAETAIAYWNDNAFINAEGVVFESDFLVGGDLPQLYGPVGTEQMVMSHYQRLNRALSNSGHFIEMLLLNERGSLEFENQHGVRILLGNVDVKQRLQRFLKVSSKIKALEMKPLRIDTRYSNGVAVNFVEAEGFDIAETFKLQREVNL